MNNFSVSHFSKFNSRILSLFLNKINFLDANEIPNQSYSSPTGKKSFMTSLPGCEDVVQSKERLIFHCGYRRFAACPIFSQVSVQSSLSEPLLPLYFVKLFMSWCVFPEPNVIKLFTTVIYEYSR